MQKEKCMIRNFFFTFFISLFRCFIFAFFTFCFFPFFPLFPFSFFIPAEYILPDAGNSFLRRALLDITTENVPSLVYESHKTNDNETVSFSSSSSCSSSSSASSHSNSNHVRICAVFLRLTSQQKELRAAELERLRQSEWLRKISFRRIWILLCNAKKPFVGHHCFYDLMFLYKALQGENRRNENRKRKNRNRNRMKSAK
jgi:CAF1 family ribonuclease